MRGLGATARAASEYAIVAAVAVLFIVLALTQDAFLTSANLANVLDQSVTVGAAAVGMTIVIISGGFDLSAGAVFAVSGIIAAKLAPDMGAPLALLLGLLAGTGIGIANGLLVTFGRITSFLATLASAILIAGLATVLTGGFTLIVSDPSFAAIGRDKLFGIKIAFWIFLLFALVVGLALHRTTFGRAIYAVGANREVARLSGLRVDVVRVIAFAISGTAAALAGILSASNLSQGQAGTGTGLELTAIAAVAIGGTSVLGGGGAMWRTLVGVMMLTLINNGMNLFGLDAAYQQVAQGAIIVLAVGLDAWARADPATRGRLRRRAPAGPPVAAVTGVEEPVPRGP
jgi:ribose transport system permease protein